MCIRDSLRPGGSSALGTVSCSATDGSFGQSSVYGTLGVPATTNVQMCIRDRKDGMRIVGIKASGEAVIFDTSTQKLQAIPGIGPGESVQGWTDDGLSLIHI